MAIRGCKVHTNVKRVRSLLVGIRHGEGNGIEGKINLPCDSLLGLGAYESLIINTRWTHNKVYN
jgi:hypothetical protein